MRTQARSIASSAYGAVLLALVLWFVIDFPIFRLPIAAGFALYAAALWRWPWLWLVVLPVLLALFDLAPLSGRFFFDEFDAAVLLTAGVLALRRTDPVSPASLPRDVQWVLALLTLSYLVSTLLRLLPLAPVTADSFANYASPYNSLRVAKGFLWALLLLNPMRQAAARGDDVKRLIATGFLVALAGVALISVYERWLFAGVFAWSTDYRTTANFSSMHTGDGPIDAWLAMAIPFLGLLFFSRRAIILLPVSIALGLLSAYALFVTSSRGPAVAVVVAYAVGLFALLVTRANRRRAAIAFASSVGFAAVIAFVALPMFAQSALGQRFAHAREDAAVRLHYWRYDLSLRDDTLLAKIFGMGVGSFPAIHQERSFREPRATRYRYVSDASGHYVRFWTDLNLYMAQVADARQNSDYQFTARVRTSERHAQFTVMWCELWMLTPNNCTTDVFALLPQADRWQTLSRPIQTKSVGSGRYFAGLFFKRPTKLTFFISGAPTGGVDVGEVSLKDAAGRELLRNGDFARGADEWFWSEDGHWQWHTADLAVNILFDQGWFGLLAVGALIWVTVARLLRQILAGDELSAVFLASIVGFVVTGVTVSTFDQPRLSFAFYLISFSALCTAASREERAQATAGRSRSNRQAQTSTRAVASRLAHAP